MASVSVSLEGDRAYKDAVAAIAARYGMTTGALIRRALERSEHGDQIDKEHRRLERLYKQAEDETNRGDV